MIDNIASTIGTFVALAGHPAYIPIPEGRGTQPDSLVGMVGRGRTSETREGVRHKARALSVL
jgi:hypothetical protein